MARGCAVHLSHRTMAYPDLEEVQHPSCTPGDGRCVTASRCCSIPAPRHPHPGGSLYGIFSLPSLQLLGAGTPQGKWAQFSARLKVLRESWQCCVHPDTKKVLWAPRSLAKTPNPHR